MPETSPQKKARMLPLPSLPEHGRNRAVIDSVLTAWAADLQAMARDAQAEPRALKALALDDALTRAARRHPNREHETVYPVELPLIADRERARFSSWYELFPRSCSPVPGRHGSFKDVQNRLPAIAAMGFDVLYFPPIHPIGTLQRKGKNNALVATPDDVGSPWAIGLAEAFTRPKVMHRLAKLGFSQSYTYFTWRNSKRELQKYFTELSDGPGQDYFRPNAWPNTPDILHEQLQSGEAAVYMVRLVLAATLTASYGIYGPVFELREHLPRAPGSEEYLDSEKYQLRHWNHDDVGSLASFITRINWVRRENAALQQNASLRFLPINNDQLSNQRFTWGGPHHFVRLDPRSVPAHIFVLRQRIRDERDFDYFL